MSSRGCSCLRLPALLHCESKRGLTLCIAGVVLILALGLAAAGCGGGNEAGASSLLGVWDWQSEEATLELMADGSAVIEDQNGPVDLVYETRDGVLTLRNDSAGRSKDYRYRLENGGLYLESFDGESSELLYRVSGSPGLSHGGKDLVGFWRLLNDVSDDESIDFQADGTAVISDSGERDVVRYAANGGILALSDNATGESIDLRYTIEGDMLYLKYLDGSEWGTLQLEE